MYELEEMKQDTRMIVMSFSIMNILGVVRGDSEKLIQLFGYRNYISIVFIIYNDELIY